MRWRSLTSWIFFCPNANSKLIVNDINYNSYPNSHAIFDGISDSNDNIYTRPTCSHQCEH
jgi:hypothetical protein